ncbi:MAG TPA: shikimate dehydrogenase [Actinomycetota bacterium]|nr:shikimate dehydrogenase [Actinomycetota bacterium]
MSRGAVALIGDPVAHSVSPRMHQAAFDHCGFEVDYVALRVRRDEVETVFDDLRGRFVGLNVTRPLKEAVIPLVDRVGPKAAAARSVNTVVFGAETYGHSTDGTGFLRALAAADVDPAGRGALVLGTGGAARAVVAALVEQGAAVSVWGRNGQAASTVAAELGAAFTPADRLAEALSGCDLLVNATPVGGDGVDSPLTPDAELRRETAVFDLVYRPRRTPLLRRAGATGCRTIQGIEMLIEQGARSFELWTERAAPVEVMRRAAYEALEGDGG